MLRLVPVRVRDVREVDVERRAAREDAIGGGEDVVERLHGRRTRRRWLRASARKSITGPHPAKPVTRSRGMSSRLPKSLTRPMISTPNGTPRSFASMRLRKSRELRDDRADRLLVRPAEQEARVEDDELRRRPSRSRPSGRACRSPSVLAVALGVAHEPGDRRVHRRARSAACAQASRTHPPTGSPSRTRTQKSISFAV